jgi:hypothetical protein
LFVLSRIVSLCRNLLRRRPVERDLNDEINAYVDLLADSKINDGLGAKAARRHALIETGGTEQIKEHVREVRMGHMFETIWQDLRFGVRMIAKTPLLSITAVVTLMLGIGATTTIFSVVNTVLLAPLPFANGDKLVMVWNTSPKEAGEISPT